MLHQGIGLAELRGAAIGQAVVGATGTPLLGDAIGVGERQQAAKPARLTGVAHRLRHRLPLELPAELPGQLPGALHGALCIACDAAFPAEQGQAAVQVGAATAQDVAFRQQRRQVTGQCAQPQRLATQQQMGDSRVAGQLGHGLPVGIQGAARIQGAEPSQQIERLGIGGLWRHVEPAQLLWRHAPAQQLQGQAGEIGLEDFRRGIGAELFVLALRPQPVAHAGLQAPCAPRTLGGGGTGNALGVEAGHAAGGVEARDARQTGVHHHTHTVDGQAGFGDVGGQHHLALAGRRRVDGRTLGVEVQLAMQWAEQNVVAPCQDLAQLLGHPANLRLPGQEHQQAAGLVGQRLLDGLQHPGFDPLASLERRPPADIHREHATFAAQHRGIAQQAGQALALQRGGHQQHLERRLAGVLRTEHGASVERQRQSQIGIQAAFVELVEDHQADAFQRRIVLQTPGENTFGDHLDTGVRPHLAVQADAITHRLPDALAQLAGQTLGSRPRGQATRFEHDDGLPGQPGCIEQGQGYAGGLASAGRGLQHHFVAFAQGRAQGR